MAALALSFSFFLFLTFVGRATLAMCRWRGGVLRAWLLSPATGLAVVVLSVMVLNQDASLPIGRFAWPLTIVLAIASTAIFFWRRPMFPTRALVPFIAIVVFSLSWTGWPMLRFNFAWLSYVNDDFVNYCLAAERFKDFPFWRAPTMDELAGTDIAQYYWFMHVPGLMRFGSEITLSWVSALTGVRSLGIFMPVIVGLGLIQLSAAAALVLHRGRWRRRAAIAAALLAASPLFMLGSLYQLIAQVGGLSLLLAAATILTGRLPAARRRHLPHILVLALVGSGLAVFYPEVSSFPVLTTVLVLLGEWLREYRRLHVRAAGSLLQRLTAALATLRAAFPLGRISLILYGCVGAILILRYNVLAYMFTVILQMGQGFRSVDLSLSLFPYFLIPTGLANLFGLMPLSINFREPFTSLTIVAGLLSLITALVFAVRESLRAVPMAILLVVQFLLALKLMLSGNDFGLYKIAMFMQPALAAGLACALLKLPWSRFTAPLGVLVAAACCAPTALYYTRVSQGEKAGGITEVKLASVLGTKPPATPAGTRLLTDINNLVAAKVAAFELRGTDLRFLSRDYYQQIAPIEFEKLGDTLVSLHPRFNDLIRTRDMLAARDEATVRTHSLFDTSFSAPALGYRTAAKNDAYLSIDESLGLFNKLQVPVGTTELSAPLPPARAFFKEMPATGARNRVVFVHSNRGHHYYLGDRHRIAIYQQEADPLTTKQDFTGLGRFLLLRVEQPDEQFYLRLSVSKSNMRGHTAWSSGSRILAASDVPLAFPGHGAVNRIVGPIRPVMRDGAAYIAIDFHETATRFPEKRPGLQSLYNTKVPLDARLLVAHGRDISALSVAEFAKLERPSRLSRFPDDLIFARGLEFAGIYEEGWLSPDSEFVLRGSTTAGCVRLRGYIPEMLGSAVGTGMLKATLGGRVFELPAATGVFDWLLPVPANADTTQLSLHFTATALLPEGDGRPVGAMLELIEVHPSLPTHTFDYGTVGRPRLPANGIDQDGWLSQHATIEIPAGGKRVLALKIEYPDWSGKPSGHLKVALSHGGASQDQALAPGSYSTILLPVAASATMQTVSLTAGDDFPLPAPDQRRRAARLVSAELQPTSE